MKHAGATGGLMDGLAPFRDGARRGELPGPALAVPLRNYGSEAPVILGGQSTRQRPAAPAWYVVETLPRAELVAQSHLQRQSFGCFFPQFEKTRRHARRVDHVLAPVFPGYLFVRFDRDRDQWLSINGTRGVKRLVGPTTRRPQPMANDVMQLLFARCQGDIVSGLFATLSPGQQVRLTFGPFADQLAQVEKLDSQGRVRVLLNILGGSRSLDVSIGALGPT